MLAPRRAIQLEITRQTALSWLDIYYTERSFGLLDQLGRQVDLLCSTVQPLIAS
jgi:hypothetical protein